MDEDNITLWQRLTDWNNSPVLNYINKVRTQWRIRSSIKYNIRKLKMGGYEDSATTALVKIGKPAVPALIKTLNEEKSTVRLESILALGKIADESAISALVGVWKEGEASERTASLRSLESIGIPALAELVLLLDDANMQIYVQEAIETIFVYCKNAGQLKEFEKKLDEGYRDLKRRNNFRNNMDRSDIHVSKMRNKIAKELDLLSENKGILLPDIPKPPRKGSIYRLPVKCAIRS